MCCVTGIRTYWCQDQGVLKASKGKTDWTNHREELMYLKLLKIKIKFKTKEVCADLIREGKEFQSLGSATEKVQSTLSFNLGQGTTNRS